MAAKQECYVVCGVAQKAFASLGFRRIEQHGAGFTAFRLAD
jgi:hypothetical protein